MRIFLIAVAVVIYFIVGDHFNDKVKGASTHGNTKHGWYSKYNKSEKNEAMIWMVGYPLAALGIYSLFLYWNKPIKLSDNSTHTENMHRTESNSNVEGSSKPVELKIQHNKGMSESNKHIWTVVVGIMLMYLIKMALSEQPSSKPANTNSYVPAQKPYVSELEKLAIPVK